MTPERWKRVKRILEDVLALPESAWARHLDARCGGDGTLRREVESFLTTSSAELDAFLEHPAVDAPPVPDGVLPRDRTPSSGEQRELRLGALAPYTRVVVTTRSTTYRVTVVAPLDLEVLVEGGQRFPRPTRARVLGPATVTVGEPIRLQVGDRRVVTSFVRTIAIDDG